MAARLGEKTLSSQRKTVVERGKVATCALVATCAFNKDDFERKYAEGAFDCVVAVDAGYRHLEEIECVPDVILGDFDSLGYVPAGKNVRKYPKKKDKSDLELALDFVEEHGFSAVRIYGSLGGRLDHTIATMQMCAHFAEQGVDMELVGEDCLLKLLVGPAVYKLPLLEKGTVSVFSAVDCAIGVSEQGMEYPLDNVELRNRTTLGLSNELVGASASISVESGTLYVFHPLAS